MKKNQYNSPIKLSYYNMKGRCRGNTKSSKKHYLDKGIKVCERWQLFKNFEEDMLSSYRDGLSLDRIDNSKGYSKDNCRWVTQKEQTRNTSRNVKYKGEYAQDAGVRLSNNKHLVAQRLHRGWTIERAFETLRLPNYGRKDYRK